VRPRLPTPAETRRVAVRPIAAVLQEMNWILRKEREVPLTTEPALSACLQLRRKPPRQAIPPVLRAAASERHTTLCGRHHSGGYAGEALAVGAHGAGLGVNVQFPHSVCAQMIPTHAPDVFRRGRGPAGRRP
jgi:hypothetical protein